MSRVGDEAARPFPLPPSVYVDQAARHPPTPALPPPLPSLHRHFPVRRLHCPRDLGPPHPWYVTYSSPPSPPPSLPSFPCSLAFCRLTLPVRFTRHSLSTYY